MNRNIWEILKIQPPPGTALDSAPTLGKGVEGTSYVFADCSHALVILTGVLTIASLKELSPTGKWHDCSFARQVSVLVDLACEVAEVADRALRLAISRLPSESVDTLSAAEVKGIQEIRFIGEVYVTLLRSVALEVKLTSFQQALPTSTGHGIGHASDASNPAPKEIQVAIQRLSQHAMALELRIENSETGMRTKNQTTSW